MRPSCPHCAKGDTQDIDLSREDIDALIEQTELIGELHIIGGEPTLRLDSLTYLLDRAKVNEVPVFRMTIVSNGLAPVEDVSDVIAQWSDYISECNAKYKEIDEAASQFVEFQVSLDDYHANAKQVRDNIVRYRHLLSGKATVNMAAGGQLPQYTGNARKNLQMSDCILSARNERKYSRQISICDKDHKPICLRWRSYRMFYEKQVIVCCALYLTAKGDIIPAEVGAGLEYEAEDDEDNRICNIREDLYKSILRFNEGKVDCFTNLIMTKRYEDESTHDRYVNLFKLGHLDKIMKKELLTSGNVDMSIPNVMNETEMSRYDSKDEIKNLLLEFRREIMQTDFLNHDTDASAK